MKPRYLAVAVALVAGCATMPTVVQTGRPFEMWVGGDDGLTGRFAKALHGAFTAAAWSSTAPDKNPKTLIVTIESNLHWIKEGGRLKASYRVSFAKAGAGRLGGVRGDCWEDEFEKCAAFVVGEASRVSARQDAPDAR